eukprot:gene6390-4593_t
MDDIRKAEGDEETFFSFFRSDFNVEAANKIVSAVGSYRPPWWYSANLGTMVAFGHDFDCHYDEEVVEAADGCRFIVSWFPRRPYLNGDLDGNPLETAIEGDVGRKQIALYVPGLGLHAESKVSKNYALRMARRGYTVGIVGVRGERLPLTCHKQNHDALLRPWHPALIDDLLATILRLHRLLPSESRRDVLDIFLTGYSAGGNIVQKTLQAIHRQNIRKEHAHPATTHRPSDASDDHEQQLVRGAFVLCLNFNYVQALRRLEQTLMGRVYSFFMCRVSTDILRKHRAELLQQLALAQGGGDDGLATEKMMDELFPADTAAGALSPSFLQMRWLLPPMQQLLAESTGTAGLLSAFDASVWRLRGFSSCDEQFQAFSMFDVDEIAVPTLMMQPRDDPLHLGDALRNIDLDALRRNPNLVFMSPRYGNHFGFYEGGLWQALMGTNRDCYSYPAKVSDCFFQSVLDHYHLRRAITRPCGGTAVYQLRSLQRQELQAHDLHLPDHPMSGPTAAPSEARPSRARKGTSRARSKSRGRARATETVAG